METAVDDHQLEPGVTDWGKDTKWHDKNQEYMTETILKTSCFFFSTTTEQGIYNKCDKSIRANIMTLFRETQPCVI